MRNRIFLTAVFLASFAPCLGETVEVKNAAIREVTVYRDRAEVVRRGRVELGAGSWSLRFANIPASVEADSLRVKIEGPQATLGATEIVRRTEKPVETPEFLAARKEVERLQREIEVLDGAVQVDQELRRFLTSVRASIVEPKKEDAQTRDAADIAAVYGLLSNELHGLSEGAIARKATREETQRQLQVARGKLAELGPGRAIHSREAEVELDAARAGRFTVTLSYVVPGASWRPSYRATLDPREGDVDWVAEGVVRQSTGEDWSDVDLRLSTAAPAGRVDPPKLQTQWLRPAMPTAVDFARVGRESIEEMAVVGRNYQNTLQLAPGVQESADMAAAPPAVQLIQSAYTVAFRVPGNSDVPADGRDHRVTLRNETLAGNPVHRIVPKMDARAYLTSVTTSPDEYPLLAGPVRVFAAGSYLGTYRLPETGPGVELTVPFGADDRIQVTPIKLPKEDSREGRGGKTREIDYAFRTEIQNLQDGPATVVFEDRIPVAEDERIEIKLDDEATTAGWEKSKRRPGVMLWTFELQAGEKRLIDLAYRVRYPAELVVE